MNWFYLTNNHDNFQEIKQINQTHINLMLSKISHTLSTSLLIVYIERAEQLPSTQYGKTLEPYPFCLIKIDNYEEKTSVIKHSTNPCWMKSFMFMLVNPEQSLLEININDSNNKNHIIGTVKISIKNLMEEKDWIINRSYPIKSPFGNSINTKLSVKLQLQIMTKIHRNIDPSVDKSLHSSIDKEIKPKIQIHLINKQDNQTIVNQQKSSQVQKKSSFIRRLFSSCLKKVTREKHSLNN
jgi:hypothetical protein